MDGLWKWVVKEESFPGALCGLNWIGFYDIDKEKEKTDMAIWCSRADVIIGMSMCVSLGSAIVKREKGKWVLY